MDKLIQLLNEFLSSIGIKNKCISYNDFAFYFENWDKLDEEIIISKRYGFVKWLWDNNMARTDDTQIYTSDAEDRDRIILEIEEWNYWIINEQYWIEWDEELLMKLAISDEPILDLIRCIERKEIYCCK